MTDCKQEKPCLITYLDVYRAAAERNVIVVGGSARTVGAVGGYVLGGGHSPFAHYHGLAADSEFWKEHTKFYKLDTKGDRCS